VTDVIAQTLAAVRLEVADEVETIALGRRVSKSVNPSLVITLQGDLGAGKTTLSRGILLGLGHTGNVKSPTYALVEPYELELGSVYHFDLYRMVDAEELEYMGFADYLSDAALCLIEWPERGEGFLPLADVNISIEQSGEGRCVTLKAQSEAGVELVQKLERSGGSFAV
jgi:tRNA threonylcarbamoyladenosine biosynthesis protein TsaE